MAGKGNGSSSSRDRNRLVVSKPRVFVARLLAGDSSSCVSRARSRASVAGRSKVVDGIPHCNTMVPGLFFDTVVAPDGDVVAMRSTEEKEGALHT